ncbi:MAG: L-threonylcarbamoyladenylate synthase [Defluviitaleaceae bacterium]|nr:L-threonylcarbamoyladenylate synthase [Defluviitaleaceae bacterium]
MPNTEIVKISEDITAADDANLRTAADVIVAGGLVAFPTETVYGLGANGLSASACAKIYQAKGRPSDNPLILHISDISQIDSLAAEVGWAARALAESFWPGPMTLVLKRTSRVPDIVAGGLDTVGIRLPKGRVARELISRAGVPIAAPSAIVSGRPSSTRAEHVAEDLGGKVDMIIDGGLSVYGLESTIVDVSGAVPCLLRPGSVTLEQLERIVGKVDTDPAVTALGLSGERPKAPGMAYVHYAPKAELTIVVGDINQARVEIARLAQEQHNAARPGTKIAIITTDEGLESYSGVPARVLSLGGRFALGEVAASLYDTLRALDERGVTHAFAEGFEETGIGFSIMNRLKKAAGYKIIQA